jgi:hypothetical protein
MTSGLFVAFGTFIVLIGCAFSAKRRREAFEERFPPLSDAEFIARCPPGTDPGIALRVRGVLAECFAIDEERIYPSARLVEDLDAG